jgi:hypothetical protein
MDFAGLFLNDDLDFAELQFHVSGDSRPHGHHDVEIEKGFPRRAEKARSLRKFKGGGNMGYAMHFQIQMSIQKIQKGQKKTTETNLLRRTTRMAARPSGANKQVKTVLNFLKNDHHSLNN